MKKFLIGMLASGENEKGEAIASIKSQSIEDYDLVVTEGLGNKEAHDALYSIFNEKAGEYEIFLKHDADMVFVSANSLSRIYDIFAKNSEFDHVMFDVKDWYSQQLIPGQNAYRNTVRWEGNEDHLIVDYHGRFKGKSARIRKMGLTCTLHGPDPSPFEAFCFGLHRASKVRQRGRDRDFPRALLHYTILDHVWRSYKNFGDIRRLYAISGAEISLNSPPDIPNEYKSDYWENYFKENVLSASEMALSSRLQDSWDDPLINGERWLVL